MGCSLTKKTVKTVFSHLFLRKLLLPLIVVLLIISPDVLPANSQATVKAFNFAPLSLNNLNFYKRSEYSALRPLDAGDRIVALVDPSTCYVFYDGYNIRNVSATSDYFFKGVHVYNSTHIILVETRIYTTIIFTKVRVVNVVTGNEVTDSVDCNPSTTVHEVCYGATVRTNAFYLCQVIKLGWRVDWKLYRLNIPDATLTLLRSGSISPIIAENLHLYNIMYMSYDETQFYAIFGNLYIAYRDDQTWTGTVSDYLYFAEQNGLALGGFVSIQPQIWAGNDFVFQLTVAGRHKRSSDPTYFNRISSYTIYFDFNSLGDLTGVRCDYNYVVYYYPGYICYSGFELNESYYQMFFSEFTVANSLNYALFKVYGQYHTLESQGTVAPLDSAFDFPCTIFYLGGILMQIEYYSASEAKFMCRATAAPPGQTLTFTTTTAAPTVTVTNTPYTSTAPFETPESHTQFLVNAIIPLVILFIPAGLFYYMVGSVGAVVGLLLGVGIGYSAGFVPFSAILIVIVAVAVLFWVKAGGGGGGEG